MPQKRINDNTVSSSDDAFKTKKRKTILKDMPEMTTKELQHKAEEFLASRKNANKLLEILELFRCESGHYQPVILTVQTVFTELLRRRDMVEVIDPTKPTKDTPATIYARWLRGNYELALNAVLGCMKRGDLDSRIQALETACELLKQEGQNPLRSGRAVVFPTERLESILKALLDAETSMTPLIRRFRAYGRYRDVQQLGLRALTTLAEPSPSQVYIQNYLDLFDSLMASGIPTEPRPRSKRHSDDLYFCEKDGKVGIVFNPEECKRCANKCWDAACQWPLRGCEGTHRRALRLLVDSLLPVLARPQLATDLLWDSLDCGRALSVLALDGVAELVTRHGIEYPSIYDRLYGMLEPAALVNRSHARLLHTAETFLGSTHIPGSLVAAFAKRLSRLAVLAPPGECVALLALVAKLLSAQPDLRRMLRERERVAIVPKDPYIMEESCATASQAIKSSLWEISALRRHFAPEVSTAASRMMAGERAPTTPATSATPEPDLTDFDRDLKMWFKNIEINFVRPSAFEGAAPAERVGALWEMDV